MNDLNKNNISNKLINKDTRWDRIRKKHINNLSVKTETIRKFIEMDFVNKEQMKSLNGDCCNKICLNPTIVMDLRHEVFTRITKSNRDFVKTTIDEKKFSLENVKNHNRNVHDRHIENELTKFKTELHQKRPKLVVNRSKLYLNLNNKILLNSLKNSECHIKSFYSTTADALQEIDNITEKLPSESSINDQKMPQIDNKCVRFEDSIEIINYSKDHSGSSNTIDEIESVTSEYFDEGLPENGSPIPQEEVITKHEDAEEKLDLSPNFQSKQNKKNQKEIQKNSVLSLVDDETLKITKIQQIKLNSPENPEIQTKNTETIDDDDNSEKVSESSDSKNEQNAIIAELFRPKFPPNEILLRKYFLKWIHFVTFEKIEKQSLLCKNDQIQKINAFLDNIRYAKSRIDTTKSVNTMNKKKDMIVLTKKYQNKIKVQQDIIELQKLKLQRQERMIMELKLTKLSEEAKKAREDIKNELKSMIRDGDHKKRSKAKCLQMVGNLRDEEDEEFEKLQGRSLMTPKFLARMKERALQRSIKHEQARQRRLQMEAEREAAKLATEEAKRLEDEEAKQQRINALKEKRRLEKMAKILKERERQKCIENNKKAQEYCRRRILRQIGMEAFKRLLRIRRCNQRKAIYHRRRTLKMKIFIAWKSYYNQIWDCKKQLADNLYVKILKRTVMRSWKLYISIQKSKYLVAIDWYELKITEYIFKHWCDLTKAEKIIEEIKTRQALSHYQWHLKWKVVERWTRLPQILKLEKETEERRQRWRMKIWELLPDYMPNRDQNI